MKISDNTISFIGAGFMVNIIMITIVTMTSFSNNKPTIVRFKKKRDISTVNKFKDMIDNVNCNENDQKMNKDIANFLSEESIVNRTENCNEYFNEMFVYANEHDVSRDSSFPIAYSHLLHHQIGIFESFMAIHFRPHDFHCIYIDQKASDIVKKSVKRIVKCYQDKFYSSRQDALNHLFLHDWTNPVYWGHVSILEADLCCLRTLVKMVKDNTINSAQAWKYYMNLAGSELPLKTIPEIRHILEHDEIGSSIDGVPIRETPDADRLQSSLGLVRTGINEFDLKLRFAKYKPSRPPAPFDLTVFKGYKNHVISFEKSEFIVSHPVAIEYYNWIHDMHIGDESFFPTLIRINETKIVDGEWKVTQNFELKTAEGFCPRATLWHNHQCKGQVIRLICNIAVPDLKPLRDLNCFIGNKFNLEIDASAVVCQVKEIISKVTTYLPLPNFTSLESKNFI